MEPIDSQEAPTPAERAARRWLLVMGVVVVVLMVATGVWYLSRTDTPDVIVVPPATGTTTPPASGFDVSVAAPRLRLTEEQGVATGTITVSGNDAAIAGDVRVAVELIVDAGADGARLVLGTDLAGAEPIDRFVVGQQRVRLDRPGWRLRCADVAPCMQTIDYRLEIPNDAVAVDVTWRVGAKLNHPSGTAPEDAEATIVVGDPDIVDTPFVVASVGANVGRAAASLLVVRILVPEGFDDPTFEVLAFARAAGTTLTVIEPTTREPAVAGEDGVAIVPPVAVCADTGECIIDLWVLATGAREPGSFWVETRSDVLQPPQPEAHDAEAVVVDGTAAPGTTLAVTLSAGDVPPTTAAVMVVEGFDHPKLLVQPLCAPECSPQVDLPVLPWVPGTTPAGETATTRTDREWRITGFLVTAGELRPETARPLTLFVLRETS